MNKVTVGAIAIVLLAFGGLVVWSSLNSGDKTDYSKYDTTKVIQPDENNGNIGDHVRGKEDSSVVLVEYADLQCPGCATMMPKISQLHDEYGDRVAFVYRNFPIQGHQNARAAAAAVEAAAKQGYYWQMIESLYDNRVDWISIYDTEKRMNVFASNFETVSGGNGDVKKFRDDTNDSNIQKKIDFDKNLGAKRDNVNETPSFYLNGEKIDLGNDMSKAKDIIAEKINEQLKKADLPIGPAETINATTE